MGNNKTSPTDWMAAWRTLERLYREDSAICAIGVSNFEAWRLRELLDLAEEAPHVVQNWMDPFHQDRSTREVCAENGIHYTAYSLLGSQWAYRTLPDRSRLPPGSNPVLSDPAVAGIAAAQGVSAAAVVLSWALQRGVSVLPRSGDLAHIREN
ncbi:unnamed protein product, partial [Phaeothamnion confervicola]